MKYIKTFEGLIKSNNSKNSKYEYLNKEEEILLYDFIDEHIKNLDILSKVDNLTLKDFEHSSFEYRTFFNDFIGLNDYNNPDSFYKKVDIFIRNNKINVKSNVNRNTIFKIEDKMYMKYKSEFTKKMNDKLIELLSNIKDLYKFKRYYDNYSDKFNSIVKGEFSYIFNADKFNL